MTFKHVLVVLARALIGLEGEFGGFEWRQPAHRVVWVEEAAVNYEVRLDRFGAPVTVPDLPARRLARRRVNVGLLVTDCPRCNALQSQRIARLVLACERLARGPEVDKDRLNERFAGLPWRGTLEEGCQRAGQRLGLFAVAARCHDGQLRYARPFTQRAVDPDVLRVGLVDGRGVHPEEVADELLERAGILGGE